MALRVMLVRPGYIANASVKIYGTVPVPGGGDIDYMYLCCARSSWLSEKQETRLDLLGTTATDICAAGQSQA